MGGRPVMFSSIPMEDISVSPDGKSLLYHDKKGYEDAWRKHHTSSITRDIWLCTEQEGAAKSYRKITSFDGEDRTPVWTPDGKSFYYLSEREGSFNIYKSDLEGKNITRLTSHTDHPVRFLSVASNGTLCYGFNGEIYTVKEGESPKKVNISIVSDSYDKHLVKWLKSSGATEISVSPEGKEIAFILRGDVYVTSVEYKTTKQITDTPEQERDIDFSPDGRSIVYASERNGLWQIYQTSLVNKEDELFTYANEFKEERLVNSIYTSFQPQYSPDGKEVAFLENRTTLRVLNLKTKAVRTVMDGKFEYSYSDGDQWFEWSPDSRWLLSGYIGHGGWNNNDVALVNASGNGEIHNLTQSGYTDSSAKWVLGGKAMIWQSDRAGYRSHGSWGAEDDVYIMFFDLDAYERFRMSKEEVAFLEEKEKKDKEEAEKKESDKKKGKKKGDAKDKEDEVKPLEFDLENCRDRIIRLTVNSSRLGDAVLSAKGDKLYYQAAFEDGYDLWMHDLKENKTSIVMKKIGYGAMMTDKKQENLYLCNSSIKKVNMEKGESKDVEFSAPFNYRPYEERLYMFNHIWKQVEDKFYVADLHGVDWKGYYENYKRFLPYINNNYDFQEMLSELLGDIGIAHQALAAFLGKERRGIGAHRVEVARGEIEQRRTVVAGAQPAVGIRIPERQAGHTVLRLTGQAALLADAVEQRLELRTVAQRQQQADLLRGRHRHRDRCAVGSTERHEEEQRLPCVEARFRRGLQQREQVLLLLRGQHVDGRKLRLQARIKRMLLKRTRAALVVERGNVDRQREKRIGRQHVPVVGTAAAGNEHHRNSRTAGQFPRSQQVFHDSRLFKGFQS